MEQRREKKKREDERENERENEEIEGFFLVFQHPQARQMNYPNMFRKNPFRTNYSSIFSFESSESDRFFFFNYLHDSNSIFRARRINSEWVFGRTVVIMTLRLPLLVM